MRGLSYAFFGLGLLLLASCNTTDALTPKADVPGARNTADNSTQTDNTNQINNTANTDALADNPVNANAPQNTLEAQQQALERGDKNPSLTDDAASNTTTTLGANLYKTNNDTTKTASNLYATNTAETKGSIRFLPIIGAPVQAVTPLSKELGTSARGNGLVIKKSSDQTAEHVLKGYLSAFGDGKNVTVVYVWDVLDNAGGRLHRIQGQESIPGTSSDAWSAVPAEMMQQIGVNTIAEYMKWKQSQG